MLTFVVDALIHFHNSHKLENDQNLMDAGCFCSPDLFILGD